MNLVLTVSSKYLTVYFHRYTFGKEGKMCTLRIKECRPDDECEYACGVDEKRSRARLFVDGKVFKDLPLYVHFTFKSVLLRLSV